VQPHDRALDVETPREKSLAREARPARKSPVHSEDGSLPPDGRSYLLVLVLVEKTVYKAKGTSLNFWLNIFGNVR
jgi:hypothetical protein